MRTFTPDEIEQIQKSFREAKSPGKQIGILADLYAVKKNDIREVLGLDKKPESPPPAKKQRASRYGAAFMAMVAGEVIDGGATQRVVANRHGVAQSTVGKWVIKEERRRAGQPQKPTIHQDFESVVQEMERGQDGAKDRQCTTRAQPACGAPGYSVYTKHGIFSGWQRATEETFATVELASQWIVRTVLESSATLHDMKIFQEHPVLPLAGMGAAAQEGR